MDVDKQYKIAIEDDSLEFYITRSMAISLKSSTSTFYRVWRREMESHRELLPDYKYQGYNDVDEKNENRETKECLDYHVQNTLDFYDKYLIMEHYYKGSTLQVIAEKTGIQPYRITADIKKALKKLKKLCGDNI